MEAEDTGGEGWKWRIKGGIVMEDTGRESEKYGGYREGESWKWRIQGEKGRDVEGYSEGEGWKWRIQGGKGAEVEDTGRERDESGEDIEGES